MSLRRYKHYTESKVGWIGQIPSKWSLSKFRFVAEVRKGKNPDLLHDQKSSPELLPYLTMDYIRGSNQNLKWVPPRPETLVATDQDVLLLWDGSNAGEFVMARSGVVSSTTALLHNKVLHPRYFFYLCKSVETEVRRSTTGMGIPHVDGDALKDTQLPIPSKDEQAAIAVFLDCETAKIDKLVNEQQRLIELLMEKRQAVISQATTKGLDPTVPMTDSGVDWLGKVPKHWKVKRLRFVLQLNPSKSEISAVDKDAMVSFIPMDAIGVNGVLSLHYESVKNH